MMTGLCNYLSRMVALRPVVFYTVMQAAVELETISRLRLQIMGTGYLLG